MEGSFYWWGEGYGLSVPTEDLKKNRGEGCPHEDRVDT
jgi:hypothetical protein